MTSLTLAERKKIAMLLERVEQLEKAERNAKNRTTSELIHRIGAERLSPPVTDDEMDAYIAEAACRIRDRAVS